MNRRSFLTRLSTGLVGACVATHLPTAYLPAKVRTTAALDYLRRAYNDFCKGRKGQYPRQIFVGRTLYEAAKVELIAMTREIHYGYFVDARYPDESLMFKAATMRPSDDLPPWGIAMFYEDPHSTVIIRHEETRWRKS